MKIKTLICWILASGLTMACDGDGTSVSSTLQGTWESTDTSLYSGTLVIDFDTITITGYSEGQTPWRDDDSKRPFRDFAKGAPLPCYTEDGNLFIKTIGDVQSIPYSYLKKGQDKYLLFRFGDRQEALKRTGN